MRIGSSVVVTVVLAGAGVSLPLTLWADAPAPNGAAIYTKRCAGCHGDDGKANTRNGKKYSIADFTAPGWSKDWPVSHIAKNVANGIKGKMPAFGEKLSPDEITAVSQRVLEIAGSAAPAAPAPAAPAAPATPAAK